MGTSASASTGNQGPGRGKKALILTLVVTSFAIFVAGSFVFAHLFLVSVALTEAVPSSGEPPQPWRPIVQPAPSSSPPPIAATRTPAIATAVSKPEPVAKRRTSFLLLGIDQRDDERGAPTRTDTMMVVSVNETDKAVAMISLPRDMWVQIPGFADNRINVANFLGDANKLPGGGPGLAKATVEHNFGLKIDYTARIDFRGFERVVDTLGGVTVNVERAIRDDEYPTEDYEVMSIFIPAGVQHMNGKVALQYARSRHSENDFGRAKRQQRLLVAIRDRALQLDVIPKLPSLIGTLLDMVQTDIPPTEFLRLANLAREVDGSNVSSLVIDDKLAPPFVGQGGADLLMPNKPAIRRAIGALLADPVVKKEGAQVEIANGTAKVGVATRVGDYLAEQGFDVVNIANADKQDYARTQILARAGSLGTANLIAETLKLAPQAVTTTSPLPEGLDIRVVVGQDAQ